MVVEVPKEASGQTAQLCMVVPAYWDFWKAEQVRHKTTSSLPLRFRQYRDAGVAGVRLCDLYNALWLDLLFVRRARLAAPHMRQRPSLTHPCCFGVEDGGKKKFPLRRVRGRGRGRGMSTKFDIVHAEGPHD